MQLDVAAGSLVQPLADDDPRQIGPFPISGVLGSGGMGRVYLGLAPTGLVAVKRVRPDLARDRKFRIRFDQELDNQGRLPAGVGPRLLATDRTAQPPWFATEYVPGVTLEEAVDLAGGRLAVSECWILLHEVATRLDALAAQGMVHRDLKPSNVILTADGVRLIDFGLSVMSLQARLTSVTGAVGTPPYMAPEQLRGHTEAPTPATDVFALGGVITYAATGEPPFGRDPAVGYRIEHHEPHLEALRGADPVLAAVVDSCLAKDPAARPAAAELSRAQAAPKAQSWLAPVSEHISARQALTRFQPDVPRWPADGTSPATGETAITLARRRVRRRAARHRADETAPTSACPDPAGPVVSPRPAPQRAAPLPGKRSRERRRHQLVLGLIALVVAAGGGIAAVTAARLPSVTQPQPTAHAPVPAPHPNASPTPGKRGPGSAPSPTPSAADRIPVTQPASTPPGQQPSVVSFASYDMLLNKATRLCLADTGNLTPEALACTKSQAWKAVTEPGNSFALTSRAAGHCLDDVVSNVVTYPCTSGATMQDWRIGAITSAGTTLVNTSDGDCLSAPSSGDGLTMAACSPSDPRQLWYDAGKT